MEHTCSLRACGSETPGEAFSFPPGWFWCPPGGEPTVWSLLQGLGFWSAKQQTPKLAACLRAVSPPNLDRSFPDRWCQCNWRGDLLKSVLPLAEKTFPGTLRHWRWECRRAVILESNEALRGETECAYTLGPSHPSLVSSPQRSTDPLRGV